MTKKGYVRVSPIAPNPLGLEPREQWEPASQLFQGLGIETMFHENAPAGGDKKFSIHRFFLRDGDELWVRSYADLGGSLERIIQCLEELADKKVRVVVIEARPGSGGEPSELSTLQALHKALREIALEKQLPGIERAKALNKYKGRTPTARAKADRVRSLAKKGKSRKQIAEKLGISPASISRILRADAAARAPADGDADAT